MTLIKIDESRAIELLEAAIAERGEDYVYERVVKPNGFGTRCVYQTNGVPSCGVGLALSKAEASSEALESLDRGDLIIQSPLGISSYAAYERLQRHGVELTPDAQQVFGYFQDRQDLGHSWGSSLEYAKERVTRAR